MLRRSLIWVVGMVLSGSALAEPPKTVDGRLVDEYGMTLYTFDQDMPGKSMCNAACQTNWPPALAESDDKASGDFTLVAMEGGKQQWAYKGHPLYRWSKDQKAGDANGQNFKNMWHVAMP